MTRCPDKGAVNTGPPLPAACDWVRLDSNSWSLAVKRTKMGHVSVSADRPQIVAETTQADSAISWLHEVTDYGDIRDFQVIERSDRAGRHILAELLHPRVVIAQQRADAACGLIWR